jgi:hypothetical protein
MCSICFANLAVARWPSPSAVKILTVAQHPPSAVDVGRITEQRQGFAEKEVTRLRQDLVSLGELELQLEAGERGGVIEIPKRCSARVFRIDHSG